MRAEGRDFTTLATQAPGANIELSPAASRSTAPPPARTSTSSTASRRTTSRPAVRQAAITDFVEEVQVKSSGYEAEYWRRTGRRRQRDHQERHELAPRLRPASASQGDALAGGFADALRRRTEPALQRPNAGRVRHLSRGRRDALVSPGFALGGPLVKDKAWFFAGYNPSLHRDAPSRSTRPRRDPSAAAQSTRRRRPRRRTSREPVGAARQQHRARASRSTTACARRRPAADARGTTPPGTTYYEGRQFPTGRFSGSARLRRSRRTSSRAARRLLLSRTTTTENFPRAAFHSEQEQRRLRRRAGRRCSTATSFTSSRRAQDTRDKFNASTLQADGTWFVTAAGQHQIKGGVQFDRIGNDVLRARRQPASRSAGDPRCRPGVPLTRGPFGYYSVRSNGVDPRAGLHHRGQRQHEQHRAVPAGLPGRSATLRSTLGLRTERERVPAYAAGPDIPTTASRSASATSLRRGSASPGI